MAEPKTKKTDASVAEFIAAVENDTRRRDAQTLDKLFRKVTGEKPAMWGPSIIGYGQYQSPTGMWPRAGFSPRKASLTVYLMEGFEHDDQALLAKLGKHKTSKVCLYINKLTDVDTAVLSQLIARSWESMQREYPQA